MKLEDFDAVFRSAVKERFALVRPALQSVVLLTDMLPSEAAELETVSKRLLSKAALQNEPTWRTVGGDEVSSIGDMLELMTETKPDLVICYRHLLGRQKDLKHSLGSAVDTLTQATDVPLLLLPPPTRPNFEQLITGLDRVLVITDHMSGDDRLVNWGVALCADQGTLFLAHVEDQAVFDRYAAVLRMIPDIDTDDTMAKFRQKLLGRPADYIETIAKALAEADISETIVPLVTMAHALSDYKRLIETHDIQLVVMNTKDTAQLAMHGMAYAISVEIQDRPLLLL
jgi:hypothetical protein